MKQVGFTFLILFLFTDFLFCTILKVPQDYSTIQSAINAVKNHDTVLVSEGTYYENINFHGKNIVVASNYIFTKNIETIRNTIIDGSKPVVADSASVVMIVSAEDSTAVLEGFTITKGSGTLALKGAWIEGGGIIIENGSKPLIKNNIIINNNTVFRKTASNGGGGGISSIKSCPTIINNIIMSNEAGYAGGIVLNWSGGIVRNNIFYNNLATSKYGSGGVMVWDAPQIKPQIVENNTIVYNTSKSITGGMSIDQAANPIARNNIVWFNKQASGKQMVKPQAGKYNNIEDYSDANNISSNPKFLENSFMLSDDSPCIDAGDTAIASSDNLDPANSAKALFPSKGNIRNDIGAYGGPSAVVLPQFDLINSIDSKTGSRQRNFDLYQNYPNPFNPETKIKFSLRESSPVMLRIYNVLGKEIETLINKEMNSGEYSISWKPNNNLCSGIYLFRLSAENYTEAKKMLYQK